MEVSSKLPDFSKLENQMVSGLFTVAMNEIVDRMFQIFFKSLGNIRRIFEDQGFERESKNAEIHFGRNV